MKIGVGMGEGSKGEGWMGVAGVKGIGDENVRFLYLKVYTLFRCIHII